PDGLVAWEAQFGDFWNVAQVIVDQFIASAEDKWRRLSGMVMLLPHGFEGQGPEHCSARVERFLLMAAEYNIQVCQPTTPAQYFHLLRRQVQRKWRKPLVVLTPKSLLRHKMVVSDEVDFTDGEFRKILPDDRISNENAKRILLCTGKVYYDLLERREEMGLDNVVIQRIEELYPLPAEQLVESLKGADKGCQVIWVQEEPRNMGAWPFVKAHFEAPIAQHYSFRCLSREASASPSTGSLQAHKMEQEELIEAAFAGIS
ncbi:MAG: 2-oxoglutarate dehydrogenase E1 component, partial [Planctomycetota bacterium]